MTWEKNNSTKVDRKPLRGGEAPTYEGEDCNRRSWEEPLDWGYKFSLANTNLCTIKKVHAHAITGLSQFSFNTFLLEKTSLRFDRKNKLPFS